MDQIPINNSIGGGGGNSWPPALRRRLGLPSTTCSSKSNSSNNDEHSADINILTTTTTQSSSTTNTSTSTLSSHELRQYIHKTYSTLTSIQRQLHRGEESYFEQSYSHGNLLQGWDNIWIEQHHHNHNSNSHTNSSGGSMYSSSMGEDSSSNNISNNNHAHHMNNNKSIPIRKMPAEYRWFTSSCGTNLPITSTDNSNGGTSGSGISRVAALERWSLIDRPPTPEVQEEKQVAKEEVDSSLKKEEKADMKGSSLVDKRVKEEGIGGRSTNDSTATQSTKDTVAVKVESNLAATMATESHHANGKEADAAADQTVGVDPMHQSKPEESTYTSLSPKVVAEAENQSNKRQPYKVADTEPQSHHTLSSAGQCSTDAEMVIEKTASSSTLESKTRKDEMNDTTSTKVRDASNPSNIQSSSSNAISSSSPTAAAADDTDQTNTATLQSNKQTETTSLNGHNSIDNTSSTMMDHPKNSIADKDSYEKIGHTTVNKGTLQEQDSSTSVSLLQSKCLDTNQLPKDDCCADDDDDINSSNKDMNANANLSKEHDGDQETNIKVQQSEPEEEEDKTETLPTSSTSTAVTGGSSRTSSSRRSTRKRKTTS